MYVHTYIRMNDIISYAFCDVYQGALIGLSVLASVLTIIIIIIIEWSLYYVVGKKECQIVSHFYHSISI